jgi:hypothetical protein
LPLNTTVSPEITAFTIAVPWFGNVID